MKETSGLEWLNIMDISVRLEFPWESLPFDVHVNLDEDAPGVSLKEGRCCILLMRVSAFLSQCLETRACVRIQFFLPAFFFFFSDSD